MNLQNIPTELTELDQWVLWRFSQNEKGEINKKPYQKSGKLAKTNDKSTWDSVDKVKLYAKNFDGVGFVFTESDGLVGIDLDNCVGENDIEEWALEIIETLNSYTEYSVRGKGIHIIFKGKMPNNAIMRKGQIEIYDKGRYFCMTGNVYNDMTQVKEFKKLPEFLKSIGFIKDNGKKQPQPKQSSPNLTNDQIIKRASKAKNGNKFTKLLNGDTSDYNSQSEADLAFVSLLTFWTQDIGQIVNILQETPLWDQKWERKDYQKRTIGKCIENRTAFYKENGVKLKAEPQKQTAQELKPEPSKAEKAVEVKYFNLTDYGNAERLVHYHGENIRYCEPLQTWLIWNEKRWKPDENLEMLRLGKDVARRIYIEAGFCEDDEKRKNTAKYARISESVSKLKAMVELTKSEIECVVSPDDLDKDLFLMNCQNGTLDLRTGNLKPHEKKDYLTKTIPVNFDPEAQCPRWMQFLDEIFLKDKDLIRFVKYAAGYSLTGNVTEECVFLCYGKGRNGKSKFLDTIEYIIGEYGKNVDPATFQERKKDASGASEDIARLKDTRFISTIETGQGGNLAENLVKQMTGNRIMSARELYQKTFQFEQKYKIWIVTNHKPNIKGTDDAIWDRIHLIPFEVYFKPEQRDPNLLAKLMCEAPGILNWMLEGCLLWQGCGLKPIPEKVRAATKEYREDMDILGKFINERCELIPDKIVSKQMLYNQYCDWCKNNGIEADSKIALGRKIMDNYNVKEKTGTGNIQLWNGILVKYDIGE